MPADRTPVIFVHGLWFHPDSWRPWIDLFSSEGYEPSAPGWPGVSATVEETRAHPERVAGYGLDAVVESYAGIIAGLSSKPVVIGHSFGGLIALRLLGQGLAAAAVAIAAAPSRGVLYLPPSTVRLAFVALRNPANFKGAVSLTRGQFRNLFSNALSQQESDALFDRWTVPSPGRPLFEAALANLSPRSPARVDVGGAERGPLLLIAGGRDRTVPPTITRSLLRLYRKSPAVTDHEELSDRGHTLQLDSGWRDVADVALGWLRAQSRD